MDINGAEILDGFVLGHFAAQYAQQLGKGFLANLLNGLIAGNDQTGVQVHIIFHALVGIGVAADLDDRHAGEALRGTAAGREHHELGARGSHAGQNLRLTARRILDPQAFLVGNMLRVFQHALDGAGAALDDGTKALFLNTGKTAGDVARCGLALAHIAANALGTVFHVGYDLIDLIGHFFVYGTAGQQVLTAQELGRFAKDDGSAQIDQLVGYIADNHSWKPCRWWYRKHRT